MSGINDEIKGAIVLEVHSQLTPLKVTVDRLDRTVRSLYSNGSGGPPGYLEKARDEDNEWKKELKELVKSHSDQLAETSDFVKTHNQRDREEQEEIILSTIFTRKSATCMYRRLNWRRASMRWRAACWAWASRPVTALASGRPIALSGP